MLAVSTESASAYRSPTRFSVDSNRSGGGGLHAEAFFRGITITRQAIATSLGMVTQVRLEWR